MPHCSEATKLFFLIVSLGGVALTKQHKHLLVRDSELLQFSSISMSAMLFEDMGNFTVMLMSEEN